MEKTDCYKCGADVEAPINTVHPLCEECEADFDVWMAQQVSAMGGHNA
mgnify:CR=1 FL=1